MTNKQPEPEWDGIISPENRMSASDIPSLEELAANKPIVEFGDNYDLLYIFSQPLEFMGVGTHLMCSIVYDKKTKQIEMRGRMRFESTGRKTCFQSKPQRYSPLSYKKLKTKASSMSSILMKDITAFVAVKPPVELEFALGEDVEAIIKKMNDSGEFNIGVAPKN